MRPDSTARLLDVARQAVLAAAREGTRLTPAPGAVPRELRAIRGNFVTLSARETGALRGCCGTLETDRPLAVDVAHNAWRCALHDPRFPPLHASETAGLDLEISLLSPLSPLPFAGRAGLVEQLVPGRTGLLLASGHRRATFLPKVWRTLPDPRAFVDALLDKGAFPASALDGAARAWSYTAESHLAPLLVTEERRSLHGA